MRENPADNADDATEEMLEGAEGLDSAETGITDDTPVDPPEGWSEADEFGTTTREAAKGESLDRKLARERPELA
jgi:hypothetical protein